ncbi:MAG: acyloxyacyl hydrolase [Pedobacter sp.]
MKLFYLMLFLILIGLPYRANAGGVPPTAFYQVGNWQLLGAESHYLDLGLGVFDATENNHGSAVGAARLELRVGKKLGFVGPAVGLLATTDGGWFGYGGLYADIVYKNLVITPMLSMGGYEEGDGKDLGGTLEFRSVLGLSWQFANRARLGLQIAHISNADMHDKNPGAEDFLLTFAWPF